MTTGSARPTFLLCPALTGTKQWFGRCWEKASQGSVAELIQSKAVLWTKLNKETLEVFLSLTVVLIHSPVEVLLSKKKKKEEERGKKIKKPGKI